MRREYWTRSALAAALGWGLLIGAAAQAPAAGPAEDFAARLADIDPADVENLFTLAAWAEDEGLIDEAVSAYRGVLDIQPAHRSAYHRLLEISQDLDLPEDPQWQQQILDELHEALGRTFNVHTSRHFLIFYAEDRSFAVGRAPVLERAHDTFYRAMRGAGFRPMPLRERLVCIILDDYDDYLAYARAFGSGNVGWASGFYSRYTNRIALFDGRTGPHLVEQLKTVEAAIARTTEARQAARVRRDADSEQHLRGLLAELRRRERWLTNRRDALAVGDNTMTTTHEAAHQLAFNSGIQNRGVAYPFWFSEGLAMGFEVDDISRPAGPAAFNAARRTGLIDAQRHGRLMPLEDFASMTKVPPDVEHEQLEDLYAQAWGLFRFLFFRHRDELRDYLAALAEDGPAMTKADLADHFEEAFGPLNRVERSFYNYIRRMR